ncbi:MAG: hypothetical protein ACR2PH_14970 [Desulfobulbia bacterium]
MFLSKWFVSSAGAKSPVKLAEITDREVFDFRSGDAGWSTDPASMISNIRLNQLLKQGWQIENEYHGPRNRNILIYLSHKGSGASARLEQDGTLVFIHDQGFDFAAPHENIWFQWMLTRFSRVPARLKLQLGKKAIVENAPAVVLSALNLVLVLLLAVT